LQKSFLFSHQKKNYFLKFPSLLKKILNRFPQPTQTDLFTTRQTVNITADKDFYYSTDRTPAGNSGLAKVAVLYSADTFVVNQTLALRINICAKIATFAKPQNVCNCT